MRYVKLLVRQVDESKFEAKFAGIGKDLLDILKQLLKFNPQERVTVKQCLENPMFDEFRNK